MQLCLAGYDAQFIIFAIKNAELIAELIAKPSKNRLFILLDCSTNTGAEPLQKLLQNRAEPLAECV